MKQTANRAAFFITAVLALAALLWLFVLRQSGDSAVASIRVDGVLLCTVDLAGSEDRVFSIEEETSLPVTFEIRDHRIRFLSSDCPDQICVKSGFLSRDGDTAICMPNRVSLTVAAS